jgi:hypothetical protein
MEATSVRSAQPGYASPPDPGRYERRIVELLDQIGQRTTGTLILDEPDVTHYRQRV